MAERAAAGQPSGEDEPAHPAWQDHWPPVRYWARVGLVIIGIVVALRMLAILQSILIVLAASTVLAIGLQPSIDWLHRRRVPRGAALALIMAAGLVIAAGTVLLIAPVVAEQVRALAEAIPGWLEDLRDAGSPLGRVGSQLQLEEQLGGMAEGAPAVLAPALAAVFQLVLVLTLTPYFALSMPQAKRWAVRLLARGDREDVLRMLNRSTALMANYIVGNLLVSVIAGVVTWIGLLILDVPYAAALAVFVAVTDLIPAVGATIGAAVVVAVAATQSPGQLIGALLLCIVYQQVENFVIVPRVMRDAIDVRPATGIIALLVGGTLAGPVGALLALPVAAMLRIVLEEFVLRDRMTAVRRADAADERERMARGGTRGGPRHPPLP